MKKVHNFCVRILDLENASKMINKERCSSLSVSKKQRKPMGLESVMDVIEPIGIIFAGKRF